VTQDTHEPDTHEPAENPLPAYDAKDCYGPTTLKTVVDPGSAADPLHPRDR
jgi:hypothetical protein